MTDVPPRRGGSLTQEKETKIERKDTPKDVGDSVRKDRGELPNEFTVLLAIVLHNIVCHI